MLNFATLGEISQSPPSHNQSKDSNLDHFLMYKSSFYGMLTCKILDFLLVDILFGITATPYDAGLNRLKMVRK